MTTQQALAAKPPQQQTATIEEVLIQGNLARLTTEQKVAYYMRVCDSLGLNPYTKPFDYLTLNGREILYARKDATDQLRKLQKVSIVSLERERLDDLYVVTATARAADGRTDSSIGAVMVKGLVGESLANALMKAETKAKRRVTLSICGLGMTDESEVESIPGAWTHDDEEYLPFREREVVDSPRPAARGSRDDLISRYSLLVAEAHDADINLDPEQWSLSSDVTVDVVKEKGIALRKLIDSRSEAAA